MTSVDPTALRLGEQMDGGRIAIKAAAQDLLRLSVELTREQVISHVEPLRRAHGHLVDALKAYEAGVVAAAHELALKLEAAFPEYGKDGPDAAQ